jgi:TM2 domain-containing membrane protein YozV
VETSFRLWITYLTIGAVNTVVGFVQRDRNRADAIKAVITQYPTMDHSMIDSVATVVVVAVVVLGLLFVAAGAGFALVMRAGRNWARVVLTVVGSLSVLFLIGPVATPLQALFQLALLVGAIVMMFQRSANDWFRPRRPAL